VAIFNLHHEHLYSFCILRYGAFLANRVGCVGTVIWAFFCCHCNLDVSASVFEHFSIVWGVFITHREKILHWYLYTVILGDCHCSGA
jgi:hypothetical protein